jgi:DNA-binding NarL/FixJ family response regulator
VGSACANQCRGFARPYLPDFLGSAAVASHLGRGVARVAHKRLADGIEDPDVRARNRPVIRVLLVDDQTSYREALAIVLDREPDISVVAQAGSLAEASGALGRIDVAVSELGLLNGDAVDVVKELRAANPRGALLIVTATADARQHARAINAGASGVLRKSVGIIEILWAVRRVAAGEHMLSPDEANEMRRLARQQEEHDHQAQLAIGRLTPREQDVLQALGEGLHDREIAERLSISTETVRTHMVHILGKLRVQSRVQALVFAARHGVVTIDRASPIG